MSRAYSSSFTAEKKMTMENYKNVYGNSGVRAYQISSDSISIKFSDGSTYVYTYESTGWQSIEIMKELAQKGVGLTTFINQRVRNKYAERLKN